MRYGYVTQEGSLLGLSANDRFGVGGDESDHLGSIFFKWASAMWTRGLGLWLPASLPQNTWLPPGLLALLLDRELIVRGLGYLVLFLDRKSTRLNSSHSQQSRMPSSA